MRRVRVHADRSHGPVRAAHDHAHGVVDTPASCRRHARAVKAITSPTSRGSAPRSSWPTPITCRSGQATSSSPSRRPAPFHGLARSHSHRRAATRCSRSATAHVDDDGVQFVRTSTAARNADARARRRHPARLGSDIAMILDECPSWPVSEPDARAAWSGRCDGSPRPPAFRRRPIGRADVHVSNRGRCSSPSCRGHVRELRGKARTERSTSVDAYASRPERGEPSFMYDIVGSRRHGCPTIGRAT